MKKSMTTINENLDTLESNLYDHQLVSAKRNERFDKMLNEVNYRVLEIKALAKYFTKNEKNVIDLSPREEEINENGIVIEEEKAN